MRPHSLLLPLLLLAGAAHAQTSPSITAADMPVVGDSLRLSQASPVLPAPRPWALGCGPLTVLGTDLVGRQVFTHAYPASPGGALVLDAAILGSFRGVLLLTVQTAQGTATRRVVRH